MTEPLLVARGVGHAFGRTQVLADVSLELAPGRLVVVAGPNGAGKTTLLRVLAGTLRPDAGEVRLQGSALSDLSRREIARSLAVVPQESHVPFPFSVREMVAEMPEDWLKNYAIAADGWVAMPLEVMMRFGQWEAILAEPEPADYLPLSRSLRHYARGVAYAAMGKVDEARAEQKAFANCRQGEDAAGLGGQ